MCVGAWYTKYVCGDLIQETSLASQSKMKVKSRKTLPAYVCEGMKELQEGKWLHTNFSLLFLSFIFLSRTQW